MRFLNKTYLTMMLFEVKFNWHLRSHRKAYGPVTITNECLISTWVKTSTVDSRNSENISLNKSLATAAKKLLGRLGGHFCGLAGPAHQGEIMVDRLQSIRYLASLWNQIGGQ